MFDQEYFHKKIVRFSLYRAVLHNWSNIIIEILQVCMYMYY